MNGFRIFVDSMLSPEVLEMLQAGTKRHELVFPSRPWLQKNAERNFRVFGVFRG